MAANPLLKAAKGGHYFSKMSAAEWAALARSKGLFKHAEAWEQARIMGWDEEHYRP